MGKDFMSILFDDIGVKIQKVAKVVAILGMISSIVGGFVLFIQGIFAFNYLPYLIFLAPVIVVINCIMAWLSVILIYGFGKLVEDVGSIRKIGMQLLKENQNKNNDNQNDKFAGNSYTFFANESKPTEEASKDSEANKPKENIISDKIWKCEKCNAENLIIRNDCWSCGNKK